MKKIFFALPGNEALTKSLTEKCGAESGKATIRQFPDGETYIKIESDVKDKLVVLVCTLNYPDDKLLPLYYLSETAKELGAKSICIVAPYLAYMRQDKRFLSGEGITSAYFAKLISSFTDYLITVDPHLHRRSSLSEIYTIPTTLIHASDVLSKWIRYNIEKPLLVGPDSESEQWVSEVAHQADAPFIILEKIRHGDNEVEISVPHIEQYKNHTPVLVDDIISTARTMIATIGHLKNMGMKKPVCIGIHGIFANTAYSDLYTAGAQEVITCNTIPHISNRIKIDESIALLIDRL
ncbi:ribose-phosphate pyrophosphokinase [Flavobacterium limnosediminis JC2902]|uniref:ribose-phosphate diphosphokinase n=1 Tax=Flavobacterium limnosediminis JC2902 TaxID=1341181 RepID=V6SGI3_9FLAO|nr:ribose-phosphate pyrophosphokinase [Flavobacterium limnosediminis]ESU25818.1 ribose-phosphate pyrophosphokinase [Flavobacterium limnosediminis JC2902]